MLPASPVFCLSEFCESDREEQALSKATVRHHAAINIHALCRREITLDLYNLPTKSRLGRSVRWPGFHPAGHTSTPPFSCTKAAA
jgi:hypothetical protein